MLLTRPPACFRHACSVPSPRRCPLAAEKLISALGDESVRWKATAEELGDSMLLLVGDVFLSAACISYTGAFTGGWMGANGDPGH